MGPKYQIGATPFGPKFLWAVYRLGLKCQGMGVGRGGARGPHPTFPLPPPAFFRYIGYLPAKLSAEIHGAPRNLNLR